MLVEAGLIAFSIACFEFAGEGPEKPQYGSIAKPPKIFPAIFTALRRLLLWGSVHRRILAYSLCCHASFISASTPGPAHEPCAPRGRLKRGASSAAVESIASAMSVALSLMQVPSGISGSAAAIASAIWHQRLGSGTNRLRLTVFGVFLVLSLFLGLGADLSGMRTFAYYMRL